MAAMLYFKRIVEGTWKKGEAVSIEDKKIESHPEVKLPDGSDIVAKLD